MPEVLTPPENYDFSGYATRNDLECADGRTIKRNAFVDSKSVVPLVWGHDHTGIEGVLGHAYLENRTDGVYMYGVFNNTAQGQDAREMVQHGDITSLSIFANNLCENGKDVIHGIIREVSLVLAGANDGAYIDNVIMHGDELSGMIINYMEPISIHHSAMINVNKEGTMPELEHGATAATTSPATKTVEEILNEMSPEQQDVVNLLVGLAYQEKSEGDKNMTHSLFAAEGGAATELAGKTGGTLSHDAFATIVADAKRGSTLGTAFLAHADTYGITNIEYLQPDPTLIDSSPQFISRRMEWVSDVMNSVHHTPFSRIKSMFADITEDAARAKGYMKGNRKKEEVFSLLKRVTTPTTIYKKQKLDRDDIIDIVDIDVVSWIKAEMRVMLDEEIARAILIGDGRLASDEDHIDPTHIRPIWTEEDLFAVKVALPTAAAATEDQKAEAFIKAAIRNRKNYKGSGSPVLYTTEDVITSCLLLEDGIKRRMYNTVADLAVALRVTKIVPVEVMEEASRDVAGVNHKLLGIMVNLNDYNVGADKGGAINMFDDFDIDYNQMKYLIETRCSGALVKPYSALVFEEVPAVG